MMILLQMSLLIDSLDLSLSDYFDPSVSLNKSSRYLSLCGLTIGVMREHKKEHGKLMKDISKLEQQLRDSV